jgi:cytochrome oxidase Cu insertion factor (SCO1/SenC/PrrC family)
MLETVLNMLRMRTVVGVVAILAAGCTGSGSSTASSASNETAAPKKLTRTEFFRAVNSECDRYKTEREALMAKYEATAEPDLKKVQRETGAVFASFADSVKALQGPEELEEAVATLFRDQERVVKDAMSGKSTDKRSAAERLKEVSDAFVAVGFDSCT